MSNALNLTPEIVRQQVDDTCKHIRELAEIVIKIAFEDATSAALSQIGPRAADARRNRAELGIDDLRSVFVEALIGTMPSSYANSTDLEVAMRGRVDENDINAGLRPRDILFTAMRRADAAEPVLIQGQRRAGTTIPDPRTFESGSHAAMAL